MTYSITSNPSALETPSSEPPMASQLALTPDLSASTPTAEPAPIASWLANHRVQIGGLGLDQIIGLDAAKE